MRPMIVILITLWLVLSTSCLDNNNRCGKLKFDQSTTYCVRPFDSTDPGPGDDKDGGDADGGGDSEAPSPVLGASCTSDAECAVYNANYCNLAASEPFCTLSDCTALPDGCPSGYDCCVSISPDWYPDHCMPSATYAVMKENLCIP